VTRVFLPAFFLGLACSACGPAPEDPARRATLQSDKDSARAAGGTANAGDAIRYACGDGSRVEVDWQAGQARLQLSNGRSVILPKAQSASKGGGDVFVGETVSLQREDDAIAVFAGAGERQDCRPVDAAE